MSECYLLVVVLVILLTSILAFGNDRQTALPVTHDWYFIVKDPVVQFFLYSVGFIIWGLERAYHLFFKKQDSLSEKIDHLINTMTHIDVKVNNIEKNFITKAEAQDKIMEGIKFIYDIRERP